jgi:hypothetical protein
MRQNRLHPAIFGERFAPNVLFFVAVEFKDILFATMCKKIRKTEQYHLTPLLLLQLSSPEHPGMP